MNYSPTEHHRRTIRLKGYDYSQNGAYFITICSHNRKQLFGEINNDEMSLNQYGAIVRDEWMRSSYIRSEIILDEFIIMPNHLHGIVFIRNVEKTHDFLDEIDQSNNFSGLKAKSISSFIAGFKSIVTKKINIIRKTDGASVWQRNYHEHIIRNEIALEKLREYVVHNPLTWEKDSLYCASS